MAKKFVCFRHQKKDGTVKYSCIQENKLYDNMSDANDDNSDFIYLDMDNSSINKMIDMLHRLSTQKLNSKNKFEIPWSELLWAGTNEKGELFCGQLFRFGKRYYICNNIPYTLEKCKINNLCPPKAGSWHEVIPDTLKKYGRDWEWDTE